MSNNAEPDCPKNYEKNWSTTKKYDNNSTQKNKEIISISNTVNFNGDMSPFYLKETFSDIQLVLDDEIIHAHKIVLVSRCKYFEAHLLNNLHLCRLDLPNVSSRVFKEVLKYLYTGALPTSVDADFIFEILLLAHEYQLKTLEIQMTEKMKSRLINVSNVCHIFNKANHSDLDDLSKHCHSIIDKHISTIIKTASFTVLSQKSMVKLLEKSTLPIPEIEVFRMVQKWCTVNKDVHNSVVECIRLKKLTKTEILQIVRPSKIIDDSKLLDAIAEIEANVTNSTNNQRKQTTNDVQPAVGTEIITHPTNRKWSPMDWRSDASSRRSNTIICLRKQREQTTIDSDPCLNTVILSSRSSRSDQREQRTLDLDPPCRCFNTMILSPRSSRSDQREQRALDLDAPCRCFNTMFHLSSSLPRYQTSNGYNLRSRSPQFEWIDE